jgi:predicted AlkP superfamily phosphohydrolase/phosphomutase
MAPRVMIIGLDGATFQFIQPMALAGRLPHLADLMARGACGELHSTFPPHTAASWSTCITGQTPGNHGTLYFHQLDPSRYSGRNGIVTSNAVRGRTIFDVAGSHGLRVVAMHVPMTFPAWPVNGVMISGYPTPAGTAACAYPRERAESVGKLHAITRTESPEQRLRFSLERISVLTDLGERALTEDAPDLFMTVFQDSDAAHHYFWRYHDQRSPAYTAEDAQRYGDYIPRIYEALDAAVGRLVAHAGPETRVFVVSDHGGSMAAPEAFQINAWLASKGLLIARDSAPSLLQRAYSMRKWLLPSALRGRLARVVAKANLEGFDELRSGLNQVDWAHTQAYRFMVTAQVEGIALNLAGRQPQGIVRPGYEYEQLRDTLVADMRALRTPDTDEPLVDEIYRREDIFGGKHVDHAPDIVFKLHPLYRVGGQAKGPIFTHVKAADLSGPRSGWHDDYGILIAAGPGIPVGAPVTGAHMLNIAPTILRALGLRAPDWMDGAVQSNVFTGDLTPVGDEPDDSWSALREPVAPRDSETPVAEDDGAEEGVYALSGAEEESIKERLANLGYL